MSRVNAPLVTFNRGRISKLALGRIDLDRTRLSAEIQTNWMPRSLGSMMVRPGFQYIGALNNNAEAKLIPFVYSTTDTALIEIGTTSMRVWVNESPVFRLGTTANISNGGFGSSDLASWTDIDESGATSEWVSGGYLGLTGTRYARAGRRQAVSASSGTLGLTVIVARGHIYFSVGSTAGADDYFPETLFGVGEYSLSITTSSTFVVQVTANTEYRSLVDTIAQESSGEMQISSTWTQGDHSLIRYTQSADVVYVACADKAPKKILRYDTNSWGIAEYFPEDGPFGAPNITNTRLTPSALAGDISLAADRPLFDTTLHQGTLFRITSVGQGTSVVPSTTDQWSNPIRVSGIGESRVFSVGIISATGYVATVRIQRSVGTTDSFSDVQGLAWTSSFVSTDHNDQLDNQIIFYRIGVGSTFTSGSPECTLRYQAGGNTGIARITAVQNSTAASASLITPIGSTLATELWEEGDWSNVRGWPTAVGFHEGRLYWAGKGKIWGSISNAYESFDLNEEGDAGPINRTIASGGVDRIQWLVSLGRLVVGSESREIQIKTSSLDEPITPANFNLREVSGYGSAPVMPVKIDERVLFVQKTQTAVMETNYSGETLDYRTIDRSVLAPEICEPAVVRMAMQRKPDTRLHCVRSDGKVALLVSEPVENVNSWIEIASTAAGGKIEDVVILPSSNEDAVYYVVKRSINGATVRYLERWAWESQARGGSSNRMADCFSVQHSTATTAVTGLNQLLGSSVIAWGATADLGSYTVSTNGTITLSQAATLVCVGLPYEAWFKSVKLAYAAEAGTALTQRKRVPHLGLVLADVHAQGLQFGPSTNSSDLDNMPLMESGASISTDAVNEVYDQPAIVFPGIWNTDSRIVLRAVAPRPCTVLGAVIQVDTRERT